MEGASLTGRAGACVLIVAAVLSLAQTLGVQASPRPPRLDTLGAPARTSAASREDEPRRHAFALRNLALPTQPSITIKTILPKKATISVPILIYHYIRMNPIPRDRIGFGLSVTPTDFEAQVGWLAANGYHAIDLKNLNNYLNNAQSLPSRPIILTFNNNYKNFYTTTY